MALAPAKKAASSPRALRWLRWIVHFLAVAIVLVLLTVLNDRWDLGRMLRTPAPIFREIWLPLLFLLVYILVWLGWWLWRLTTEPIDDSSDFPDVDDAWEEAVRALNEAGIHLESTPLFLVLGRPRGTEEALFSAAKIKLAVNQAPRRPDSPLYLYANNDAIFVVCAGASLTGKLATLLAEASDETPVRRAAVEQSATARSPRKSKRLLSDAEQAAVATARFRRLCRRIRESRAPYCGVNGVLALIPFAAGDDDDEAQQAAAVCRRDVAVVREELKTHCPLYVVVCDLETADGFSEFLRLLPSELRDRPMGRDFPLMPDLDRAAIPPMIESGVRWINRDLVRAAVYKLLRAEEMGADPNGVQDNRLLYRFCEQMRRREDRLSHLVSRLAAIDWPGPPLLAGCYFAATGRSTEREQAFLAGVFSSMVETQNAVSWTEQVVREDREFKRWARSGYIALSFTASALIVLSYYIWFRA
jgi:hypothetical protein